MVDYLFTKVLFFSDPEVGKRTFKKKFCFYFTENYKPTFGVDIFKLNMKIELQGITAELSFWDISEDPYLTRLPYYTGADGAILMYDITNPNSLNRIPDWTQEIRKYSGDIPILLLGNKLDLEDKRLVSKEQRSSVKKMNRLSSIREVSLKTEENIDSVFKELVGLMIKSKCSILS